MKRVIAVFASFFCMVAMGGCGGGSSRTSGSNNGNSNGGNPSLAAGSELLYVGDNAGTIHGFGVDPNSGALTALPPVVVTNGAAAGDLGLAADPGGMVLYATSAGVGGPNVGSFIVNKTSGGLSTAGNLSLSVPPRKVATVGPIYVIPDPSANSAEMFAVGVNGNTGAITQGPTIALPAAPHDLTIVPFGNNLPSWIGVTFDGNSGGEIEGIMLQPNGSAAGTQLGATSTGGSSPQGIRATPDARFVFVANQGTNTVSAFSLNSSTGALAAVPGSPFATGSAPGPVAIYPPPVAVTSTSCCPSGKFVLVGNTGDNSLSVYSIDSTGSLTPVTGTPVSLGSNAQPQSIAVDPSGKFVYVSIAPQEVAGFALDQGTGALTPITGSPFSIGAVTRDMVFVP